MSDVNVDTCYREQDKLTPLSTCHDSWAGDVFETELSIANIYKCLLNIKFPVARNII